MTQSFIVLVNGADVTSSIANANLTENMNRLYNVCTLQSERAIPAESTVSVILGNKVFNGFVYSVSKNSEKNYTVICRTHSAKLTEPYFSSSDYALEDATTSYELCALYASKYGVPIVNNAIDLNFGGNYERRGTPLAALTTIANITGAEFWHDGTSIIISPNKSITSMGATLKDSDIFNFIPYNDTIHQNGVGKITVGTVSDVSTISTDITCNAEVDKCSGEVMVRVVPHTALDSSSGIELTEVKTPMLYQSILSASFSVKLDADIESIVSVSINAEIVTDYNFLNDTIYFSSEKRGIITVDYVGYGYRGYANIVRVGVDRYSQFDIFYGSCEKYSFQDNMNCKHEDGYSICGGVFTITPKDMNYAKGFTFYTIGGDPKFSFYSNTQQIVQTASTLNRLLDWVESATLSLEAGGVIRHKLRFLADSIMEVRAGGEDITSSTTLNGEYLEFDGIYLGVVISYTTLGREHYVNFGENFPNENIRMIVSGDVQGGCEYELSGYSQDNTMATPCVEGVTVPVNMIEELGVKPFEAIKKPINITTPSASTSIVYTDNFGILKIPNVIFGEYTLDVNSIRKNSKMKLLAGGK